MLFSQIHRIFLVRSCSLRIVASKLHTICSSFSWFYLSSFSSLSLNNLFWNMINIFKLAKTHLIWLGKKTLPSTFISILWLEMSKWVSTHELTRLTTGSSRVRLRRIQFFLKVGWTQPDSLNPRVKRVWAGLRVGWPLNPPTYFNNFLFFFNNYLLFLII